MYKFIVFIVFLIPHFSFSTTDNNLKETAQKELIEAYNEKNIQYSPIAEPFIFNNAIMTVSSKAPISLLRTDPIHIALQIQSFQPLGTHVLATGEEFSLENFSHTTLISLDLEYPLTHFEQTKNNLRLGLKGQIGFAQNKANLFSTQSNFTYENVKLYSLLFGFGLFIHLNPLPKIKNLYLGLHLGATSLIYTQSTVNTVAQTSSQLWGLQASSEIQWNFLSFMFTRVYYTYRTPLVDSNAKITSHHIGTGLGVSL